MSALEISVRDQVVVQQLQDLVADVVELLLDGQPKRIRLRRINIVHRARSLLRVTTFC